MPWHIDIHYDVVWCGSTVDAWGEKGALLPPRDERRNANWDKTPPQRIARPAPLLSGGHQRHAQAVSGAELQAPGARRALVRLARPADERGSAPMRTLAIRLLGVGAWLSLATALPGIWIAGFCRGWAVALDVPDVTDPPIRRYPTPVLTETDMALLLGTHEDAIRRGRAHWQ